MTSDMQWTRRRSAPKRYLKPRQAWPSVDLDSAALVEDLIRKTRAATATLMGVTAELAEQAWSVTVQKLSRPA